MVYLRVHGVIITLPTNKLLSFSASVETFGFVWFEDVGGQSRILKDVLKSGAEKPIHTVKGGIQINDYLTYNW